MSGSDARSNGWETSVCYRCTRSPCCNYLPLYRMEIDTEADLIALSRVLQTPWFEAGLYETGTWMLFHRATCRAYEASTSKCRLHGTARQPLICDLYSPVNCWYLSAYADQETPNFIRFDLPRIELLRSMIIFDFQGAVAKVPDWDRMYREIRSAPLDQVRYHEQLSAAPGRFVFRLRAPRTVRQYSIMTFRLGFPGVRILRSAEAWYAEAPSSSEGTVVFPEHRPSTARDRAPGERLVEVSARGIAAAARSAPSSSREGEPPEPASADRGPMTTL